ncbi:pancreatic triacylglycerol lipase-like [Pectinophora gossypiella]|uniref:pancreatic triacylglycerol lipase-like n=1 Tax=Pectinophora gossypiella TaxID=13191 RepID=UPI00214ECDF5|nr:pancreatic triacylglycerol lipase-like [Pectinophora gossypiella]XP_049880894.1 pancreatic triacylglycerol lipase-like [Pectinophora gossypiella]
MIKLLLIVWAAFVAVSHAGPVPSVPGDNSHYVEGESRYIWMSDDDTEPRLVDLQEPVDEDLLLTRNGANNQYWLYTRSNPTNPQQIVHGNANTIWNSNYGTNLPVKILVHGWTGSMNSGMNPLLTSAFLAVMNCNVIVVDWRGVAGGNYVNAVNGVPNVGQHVGNFLTWLINTTRGNWNNVHLVGFSLGAHVVGNAGRTTGNRPARVTGLDPAGPLWHSNGNALRASDGQYVEAIHTDGYLQGIMTAIGQANFYPNGGRNPQPGCSDSICSHDRAPSLFAVTIRYNRHIGRLCANLSQAQSNSCTGSTFHMGNSIINKRGNGIYGLQTGASWPY